MGDEAAKIISDEGDDGIDDAQGESSLTRGRERSNPGCQQLVEPAGYHRTGEERRANHHREEHRVHDIVEVIDARRGMPPEGAAEIAMVELAPRGARAGDPPSDSADDQGRDQEWPKERRVILQEGSAGLEQIV